MNAPPPFSLPPMLLPSEVGPYLRALRDHFGLSLQEVSERLHIRVRYLDAMETGGFDVMPGAAYARGYLQTYAVFLGLDGEEVVARCFGGAAPVSSTPSALVRPLTAPRTLPQFRWHAWRGAATLLVLLAVLVLALAQWRTMQHQDQAPIPVPEVPESLLNAMRTAVMPTPENFDCLMGDVSLWVCLHAQPRWRMWADPLPFLPLAAVEMAPIGPVAKLHFPATSEPTP